MGMIDDLAGLDLQIASGEDAVHPADFEVPVPKTGTPTLSMSMTTEAGSLNLPDGVSVPMQPDQHVAMEMITYDQVHSTEAELAMKALLAAGFTRQEDDHDFATFVHGERVFVVMAEPPTLVLIRLTPQTPPKDPTP